MLSYLKSFDNFSWWQQLAITGIMLIAISAFIAFLVISIHVYRTLKRTNISVKYNKKSTEEINQQLGGYKK